MGDDSGKLYGYLIPGEGSCTRRIIIRDQPIEDALELVLLGTEVGLSLLERIVPSTDVRTRIRSGVSAIEGVLRYDDEGFYPSITVRDASYWDVVAERIRRFLAHLLALRLGEVQVHLLN